MNNIMTIYYAISIMIAIGLVTGINMNVRVTEETANSELLRLFVLMFVASIFWPALIVLLFLCLNESIRGWVVNFVLTGKVK